MTNLKKQQQGKKSELGVFLLASSSLVERKTGGGVMGACTKES